MKIKRAEKLVKYLFQKIDRKQNYFQFKKLKLIAEIIKTITTKCL